MWKKLAEGLSKSFLGGGLLGSFLPGGPNIGGVPATLFGGLLPSLISAFTKKKEPVRNPFQGGFGFNLLDPIEDPLRDIPPEALTAQNLARAYLQARMRR